MGVAILGAGMLGTCLALEMSQRGLKVDLYDREVDCITQAGQRNEGKIHLGFVYGADPSHKTSETMLKGAMEFLPLLRRWIGAELDSVSVSSPFIYAIERDSLLSVQDCEEHFLRLDEKLLDWSPFTYPGGRLSRVEKLSDRECRRHFNPDRILAAYRTPERSIDVRKLAEILRRRVNQSELISFHPCCEIDGVSVVGNQVEIEFQRSGQKQTKDYDVVINALWDGRLALDRQVGLSDEAPWSYRIKHAIFLQCDPYPNAPSATLIQGPYGDLVHFGQGHYYVSWYPTCMQGFAKNVTHPPQWDRNLPLDIAERMSLEAISKLSVYIPSLSSINRENIQDLSVVGGIIYAHGETDVHDPKSGLHNRYQLNIQSKGGYYSINPGKYSLCPYFAYQTAHQICSIYPAPIPFKSTESYQNIEAKNLSR